MTLPAKGPWLAYIYMVVPGLSDPVLVSCLRRDIVV